MELTIGIKNCYMHENSCSADYKTEVLNYYNTASSVVFKFSFRMHIYVSFELCVNCNCLRAVSKHTSCSHKTAVVKAIALQMSFV